MEMLNVAHLKDERPAFVSQSIYKTFLILRAFIMAPEMMVINNPLTNLDELHRECFLSMISLFKKEHGLKHLFVISDDEILLERLNPIKLLLHDGKISYEKNRMSA
jgi:ABC-type molybdenum transport system ATPase subunit/photorepair protein PhrA